jgi:hypothetical protein
MELNKAKAVAAIARHKEERSSEDGSGSKLGPVVHGGHAPACTCDAEGEEGE